MSSDHWSSVSDPMEGILYTGILGTGKVTLIISYDPRRETKSFSD